MSDSTIKGLQEIADLPVYVLRRPLLLAAIRDLKDLSSRLLKAESESNKQVLQEGDLKLADLETENEKLRQWVKDLQSAMYINCVYCGHRYGPKGDTPVAMADVLKDHIELCSKHPMSKLKADNKALKDKIRKVLDLSLTAETDKAAHSLLYDIKNMLKGGVE